MIVPKKPKNESSRLETLHQLDLLDTPQEPIFDLIVTLAASIANTPMALISIVADNRQWFKAKVGLDSSETPRNVSFCGHAILQSEPFIIENALSDIRFCDNPLVIGAPNIVFYAGVPLMIDQAGNYHNKDKPLEKHCVGTLCVLDQKPRVISRQTVALLNKLAELIIHAIEMRTKLIRSAHLSAIGELSSNLSHEIKNPLSIILGHLEILKKSHQETGAVEDCTQKIRKQAIRINHIIDGLRATHGNNNAHPFELIDLRETIQEVAEFAQTKFKKNNIQLTTHLPDPLVVQCRDFQIAQVIVNLLNNAFDAVKDSKIRKVQITGMKANSHFEICIIDTGLLSLFRLSHLMRPVIFQVTQKIHQIGLIC